jgi:hypothetical protein
VCIDWLACALPAQPPVLALVLAWLPLVQRSSLLHRLDVLALPTPGCVASLLPVE